MPKYSNGKIYKLKSSHTDKVYIGSTTLDLDIRKQKHKEAYKLYKDGKKQRYCSSFEIVKYPDFTIELVEEKKCNSLSSLLKTETEVIHRTSKTVNQMNPKKIK